LLHIYSLLSSGNVDRGIKVMRWAGHIARMGVMRNSYKIIVGKYERKCPLDK